MCQTKLNIQKQKGVGSTTSTTAPVKETPKKSPPPPVSGDVVPPTFAQRNALPGIGAMQMNEEIQMPEQPKSNVAFDPTGPDNINERGPTRLITADKDQTVRPDGIRLFQDKKTKEYIYRDGNNNEIIRGIDRNALENQIAALQPGFSGFDTQLAEAEAPVQRQDLTGVKPNFAAVTPTNGQTAANNQTVIAQQNGTTNAPASTTGAPGPNHGATKVPALAPTTAPVPAPDSILPPILPVRSFCVEVYALLSLAVCFQICPPTVATAAGIATVDAAVPAAFPAVLATPCVTASPVGAIAAGTPAVAALTPDTTLVEVFAKLAPTSAAPGVKDPMLLAIVVVAGAAYIGAT